MIKIGIELDASSICVGLVEDRAVRVVHEAPMPEEAGAAKRSQLYALIERFPVDQAARIGVSVAHADDAGPDAEGEEQPLASRLEERYGVSSVVRNAAQCFALAEYCYGSGRDQSPVVGLLLNRGLDGGIVVDGTLLTGRTSEAGSFGAAPYKDGRYKHYCGTAFFERKHETTVEEALARADDGESSARALFEEMGTHLGRAVQSVVSAVDPACIVLGGPLRHAHAHFEDAMWDTLNTLASPPVLDALTIRVSQLKRPYLLGAAALGRTEAAY